MLQAWEAEAEGWAWAVAGPVWVAEGWAWAAASWAWAWVVVGWAWAVAGWAAVEAGWGLGAVERAGWSHQAFPQRPPSVPARALRPPAAALALQQEGLPPWAAPGALVQASGLPRAQEAAAARCRLQAATAAQAQALPLAHHRSGVGARHPLQAQAPPQASCPVGPGQSPRAPALAPR